MELTEGGCSRGERRLGHLHESGDAIYTRKREMTKMPPAGKAIYMRWHGRGETIHSYSRTGSILRPASFRGSIRRPRSHQANEMDGRMFQIAEEGR